MSPAVLLVLQISITMPAGGPLPPADAVRVLQSSRSERDLSRGLYPSAALPVVLTLPSRPAEPVRSWIDEFDRNQARLRALDRDRDRAPNLSACPPASRTCVIIEDAPRRRSRGRR